MKIGDARRGTRTGGTCPRSSPIFRAKPGSEASRLAGPASGRRKEYAERSRADSLVTIPEIPLRGVRVFITYGRCQPFLY
jgi:hypothetical protein